MSTSFILCGPSFSGKTHVASQICKATGAILISFDDLSKELFSEKIALEIDDWQNVKDEAIRRYKVSLEQNQNVVWDSTNSLRSHRQELLELAKEFDSDAFIIYLDTAKEVIYARRGRNTEYPTRHRVDDVDFITTMENWQSPLPEEGNLVVLSSSEDISQFISSLRKR